ncbi:MAG TPA: caspase family protein [Xanthobacteraceae bacterium]
MSPTLLPTRAPRGAALACALGLLWQTAAYAAVQIQAEPQANLRGPEGGEVRALVVGIDAYRHVRPLKGAVADARDIEASLRKAGVTDLTTLMDAQADRAAVMREMDRLIQRSRAGDLVVLSLAGHGAQEPERVKGSQPDGMDNIFLLAGFETTPVGSQQRIIGSEFNALIKKMEGKGARVLFVADTCHGGGMAREIDPRAAEMSFRQVPRYTLPVDALKPIATAQDSFLTELDFEHTTFLAAVDRKTKAPEVRIPGVTGFRGALSYAVARAFEGQADEDGDGKVTMKELFGNVRQVVYQLSDQRQNPVTVAPAHRSIDNEVAFLTRGVKIMGETEPAPASAPAQAQPRPAEPQRPTEAAVRPPEPQKPAGKPPLAVGPVRIASLDGQREKLRGLTVLESPFEVVAPSDQPDLVWDPKTGDVIVGGDVIAYKTEKGELPSVIDRAAAVRGYKQLAAKAPQALRLTPDDKLHRNDAKVAVEVSGVAGRSLILFNVAGDGTVQALYPIGSDPAVVPTAQHSLPVRVREPFGADQVIAITSAERMTQLEQALKQLNQRRTAVQMLKMIERHAPADARIGTIGLFTAP